MDDRLHNAPINALLQDSTIDRYFSNMTPMPARLVSLPNRYDSSVPETVATSGITGRVAPPPNWDSFYERVARTSQSRNYPPTCFSSKL